MYQNVLSDLDVRTVLNDLAEQKALGDLDIPQEAHVGVERKAGAVRKDPLPARTVRRCQTSCRVVHLPPVGPQEVAVVLVVQLVHLDPQRVCAKIF
jgi:hypothetical protein